jgi:pilus assembly protein CpaE
MAGTRVWATGDWTELADLHAHLAAQPALELTDEVPDDAQPDVVVHVTRDESALGGEVARVREHSTAPVVLLTWSRSPHVVEEAVKADVAEMVLLPQAAESVAFAVLKAARAAQVQREATGESGRIVTVFSPKGGTGKSVTACNLAVALAEAGHRTLLVDLDLQFGDVAIMLGLRPAKTLHDLVTAPGRLDGEKLAGYTVAHSSGLHVLAAPIRPEDAEDVTDTRLGGLLDVAAQEYDIVVVDTAPFLYGPTLETLDRTTDLLLLLAPDVPALKNVRLTLQTLKLLSFPEERMRLVLNRASERIGLRASEVSSVLERRVEFELPDDELVTAAVNRATPLVQFRPQAPFAVALQALRESLFAADAAEERPAKKRFALGRAR